MSRNTQWRRNCTDTVSWRQDQALNTTIYIVREVGPTGFLLKEEDEARPFKTFLGDPHTCTCPTYRKEKDVCKHIAWLILKKFKVSRTSEVSWQYGLVEREVNELLRGLLAQQQRERGGGGRVRQTANQRAENGGKGPPAPDGRLALGQRAINEDDVCPICQEELLAKRLPVTYCKYGCGNSIHIKCMKVWADHQEGRSSDKVIRCPMCREDFGPLDYLKAEYFNSDSSKPFANQTEHLGTVCRGCESSPISGKCYRCETCHEFHLCRNCFNTPIHSIHRFEFRQKTTQRWRHAPRNLSVLPSAVVNSLESREIDDADYDVLLQLDNVPAAGQPSCDVPEEVIRKLPSQRVRESSKLLGPGQQCRVCLRAYAVGEMVKRLPCRHKFHQTCIDGWLLHQQSCCPIDGQLVWSAQAEAAERQERRRAVQTQNTTGPSASSGGVVPTDGTNEMLEIPGMGIAHWNPSASTFTTDNSAAAAGDFRHQTQGRRQVLNGPAAVNGMMAGRTVKQSPGQMGRPTPLRLRTLRGLSHSGSDPNLQQGRQLKGKPERRLSMQERSLSAGSAVGLSQPAVNQRDHIDLSVQSMLSSVSAFDATSRQFTSQSVTPSAAMAAQNGRRNSKSREGRRSGAKTVATDRLPPRNTEQLSSDFANLFVGSGLFTQTTPLLSAIDQRKKMTKQAAKKQTTLNRGKLNSENARSTGIELVGTAVLNAD